ncbi:MAG: hypothetical protein K2J93_02685 [Anaeroplasmataceae bacterium]|nr:hypothetical protein [Anaeroplasmataceae bacterium]
MKKLEIDFKSYPTKQKLFSFLLKRITGLYGSNYDALIDALSFYDTSLTIYLINLNNYEEPTDLLEILEIIHKNNTFISYNIKA